VATHEGEPVTSLSLFEQVLNVSHLCGFYNPNGVKETETAVRNLA